MMKNMKLRKPKYIHWCIEKGEHHHGICDTEAKRLCVRVRKDHKKCDLVRFVQEGK